MAVTAVPRKITLKRSSGEIELNEPTPGASIEAIRAFNQNEYPELATCGVDQEDGKITFKVQAGTRG